jgi:hypothetical protein
MIVILNARAGTAAKSGNLQSRIAELFCAAGLNAGICTGRLLLDPAHRAHPHLSRSPLSDRRYRRPRGRSLLAGLLLDCIRNLALATLLNSTFQLEGRRLNGT